MDDLENQNWQSILKIFHNIEKVDRSTAKSQYESLKELAKTKKLTPRQLEGIISRCDYRISLIDNPNQEPFSNMDKEAKRLNLSKEQSNGKHD